MSEVISVTMEETAKILSILREYYPRDVAATNLQTKVRAWYLLFADVPYQAAQAAVLAFVANDKKGFMPSPGQVLDRLNMLADDGMDSAEAWRLVKKALGNSTYGAKEEFDKLPDLVQRVVGSPSQLREWAAMDVEDLDTVVASNFARIYRERQTRQKEVAVLPGEVRNVLCGLVDKLALTE